MKASKSLGKYIVLGNTYKASTKNAARIKSDVQKFLDSGKQIQQIPVGVTAWGTQSELQKATLANKLARFGSKETT